MVAGFAGKIPPPFHMFRACKGQLELMNLCGHQ